MEIKIGVQDTPREIGLESTQSKDEVAQAVADAVASGSMLSLTDDKGRTVLVPGAKIAYVEIGLESARKVGFGAR